MRSDSLNEQMMPRLPQFRFTATGDSSRWRTVCAPRSGHLVLLLGVKTLYTGWYVEQGRACDISMKVRAVNVYYSRDTGKHPRYRSVTGDHQLGSRIWISPVSVIATVSQSPSKIHRHTRSSKEYINGSCADPIFPSAAACVSFRILSRIAARPRMASSPHEWNLWPEQSLSLTMNKSSTGFQELIPSVSSALLSFLLLRICASLVSFRTIFKRFEFSISAGLQVSVWGFLMRNPPVLSLKTRWSGRFSCCLRERRKWDIHLTVKQGEYDLFQTSMVAWGSSCISSSVFVLRDRKVSSSEKRFRTLIPRAYEAFQIALNEVLKNYWWDSGLLN